MSDVAATSLRPTLFKNGKPHLQLVKGLWRCYHIDYVWTGISPDMGMAFKLFRARNRV